MFSRMRRPRLSVIVNMYNMRREAERTLLSLTTGYQQSVEESDYEVLVIENGSTEPLDAEWVRKFGKQFRYFFMDFHSLSPCQAINAGVRLARASRVLCCIDGARILSPHLIQRSLQAMDLFSHPFVYTLSMHIGAKLQNLAVDEGYNQQEEDELLERINWFGNPYSLFSVSSTASSSGDGYYSTIVESNAFCLYKRDFWRLGGFNERFQSKGGGLVNLDFFNKVHENKLFSPILLLGEATFHQFHGGVATNVSQKDHPFPEMVAEYQDIYGKPFDYSAVYPPFLFGRWVPEAARLYESRLSVCA